MADLSWLVAGLGGVVGGVAGEVRTQRRVGRRLDSRLAPRWAALSGFERYAVGRTLRRGRALDDAELGAEVATALRAELDRRWFLWLFGGLGAVFMLLAGVTLAAGKYALAGIEALIAAFFLWFAVWQTYARRRLAVAEEANRKLAEGYER